MPLKTLMGSVLIRPFTLTHSLYSSIPGLEPLVYGNPWIPVHIGVGIRYPIYKYLNYITPEEHHENTKLDQSPHRNKNESI